MTEAAAARAENEPLIVGRYALFDALASGGMATVHLGWLIGAVGFGRTVAVKRLHSHFTTDPDFVTMFMDEARIVARIRHPNVVPMVEVIESSMGLFLVMEYVHGESFSRLLRTCRATNQTVPIKLLNSIMHGVLLGLHAAHETKGVDGELLDVVHRDVSPQNIIVGADGVARVLDFGVAKAAGRAQVTRDGQIKGKLAYMSPEHIRGKVDRRADVFAAAVVLWEALAGRRLHEGAKDVEIVTRVVKGSFPPPSEFRSDVSPELDAIVMRGLHADRDKRYPNAREMAIDLERKAGLANPSEIGEWVERLASDALRDRAARVAAMEKLSVDLKPVNSMPPPEFGMDIDEPGSLPSDPNRLAASITGAGPYSEFTSESLAVSGMESVFSTGSTPLATEIPVPPPRREIGLAVALMSVCVVLALVGVVLGGYSIYARSGSAPPASATSIPSARTSAPASASATPSAPNVPAEPSSKPTSRVEADPAVASTDVGTTARPPMATPVPAHRPTATAQPTPKKNCDPPYTVDELGHRKYKMECMGAD